MPEPVTLDQARAAKAAMLERLRDLPVSAAVGITSVGSGYGVKVSLQSRLPEAASLPDSIDGVPVVVEVVGRVTKRNPGA